MIYTLKRDDMPLLSQWIKKEATFGRQKLLLFWRRWREKVETLRVSSPRHRRIVVCLRLDTLGLAYSLLCGVKRCENDTQSFSLSFQIRTGCKQPILIGGCLQKKKKTRFCVSFFFWRRHPDLNRGITVLQTVALPLGYDAIFLGFISAG